MEVTGDAQGRYNVTAVEIPETVEHNGKTYTVTRIGKMAFMNCPTTLKSVVIPNTVTEIGHEAFMVSYGITEITIPSSVTSIEYEAFRKLYYMTSITIPSSVTSIGNDAFVNCSALSTVTDCSGTLLNNDGTKNEAACQRLGITNSNVVVLGYSSNEVLYPFIVEAGEDPLQIDPNQTLHFSHLILRAIDEDKPVVIVPESGNIMINTLEGGLHDLWYEWEVVIGKNYFVSLPCDVYWDDIKY